MNDLPNVLNRVDGNQPFLLDTKISCLLYADDLILISKTPQGLQKLISSTKRFYNKMQLTINTTKTKVMTAHKRNIDGQYFAVYGKKIEIVKSFCYLGFELNTKSTFIDTIIDTVKLIEHTWL